MRQNEEVQKKIGEVDISEIVIDLTCRDEVPKLLMGLKYIYCNPEIKDKIFKIFEEMIPDKKKKRIGRKGMSIWEIFVMGMLRLNCNWDYDKLQDQANNHKAIRQMLGKTEFTVDRYALQTLRENISLFTPEILSKINEVVVKAGHDLIGEKAKKGLKVKVDSFVVETDVHFPTDISLLFDAMRKVITGIVGFFKNAGLTGFRQGKHTIGKLKKKVMSIQRLKRSTSKDQVKIGKSDKRIKKEYRNYLKDIENILLKVTDSLKMVTNIPLEMTLEHYIRLALKLMDQVNRRVLKGEVIHHEEKIFSIFEPHTEWISKGKAGVPQELGVRVCVVQDQFGFMLNHMVMEKKTDEAVAVSIMEETISVFNNIRQVSYDKGFYSPENKSKLGKMVDKLIMTRKGKLTIDEKEREKTEEYRVAKRAHRAVESGISAMENHGLDRCLDHGIVGFKRYVSLSFVARNIQIMGHILVQKEIKRQEREARLPGKKKIMKAA